MPTTIGQIMVNDTLPPDFRDYQRTLTRDEADGLLGRVARERPDLYRELTHQLVQLGREASYLEGSTLRLSSLHPTFDLKELLTHVTQQERKIERAKDMTEDEKDKARAIVYGEVQQLIADQTFHSALQQENPFAIQVKSRARGSKPQLAALLSTPSVYQDAQERIVPFFIRNSFAHGLDPAEYWAGTYGARKGTVDVKLSTARGGALGKQMANTAMTLVVTRDDCETPQGLPVAAHDQDNIGSVLARPVAGFPAGTVVSKEMLGEFDKRKIEDIVVRSPATCSLPEGVCKKCAGHRETGGFPEIGYHLGLNATSALAERITQGALGSKHSGGQRGAKPTFAGFDVIQGLANIPSTFPHRAAVAEQDGRIDKIEPAPQGGFNVRIGDELHYVGPELSLSVKEGDDVEAGDQLSDGIVNPADAVRLKGIGEGRRYFIDRMTRAFRESGYGVNRRNVEALGRSMIDHITIDEPEGLGDQLPGDVVSYNALAYSYRPRKDAVQAAPKAMIGKFLEQPVQHYTIGTRVTKRIANDMKRYGVESVMAHPVQPAFSPLMISAVKNPQYGKDWMARLGSTYLEQRLLHDVHVGAGSKEHSLDPRPSLARGVEFGTPPGKEFAY